MRPEKAIDAGQKGRISADASLFSVALSCIFNVLDRFRWLHKTLRIQEKQSDRGLIGPA
jgi:hypothetical protein